METKDFNIFIKGLKLGRHRFDYSIADSFFTLFDKSPIQKANLDVALLLEKSETMLLVDVNINGKAELICDRSSDPFWHEVAIEEKLIYKYGQEEKELDESLFEILPETPYINVAQQIYELIVVSLPMRKLHPKFSDEEADSQPWTYTSRDAESHNNNEEAADPRWEALRKLKENGKG